jgi:hypothetical protein
LPQFHDEVECIVQALVREKTSFCRIVMRAGGKTLSDRTPHHERDENILVMGHEGETSEKALC